MRQVAVLTSVPIHLLGEGQRIPQMLGRLSELPGVETHVVETHIYVPGAGPVYTGEKVKEALDTILRQGPTVIIIAQPVAAALPALLEAQKRGAKLVYDRFESWKDFPGNETWYRPQQETAIIVASDGLVSTYRDSLFDSYDRPKLLLPNAASDAPLWPQTQLKGSRGRSVALASSAVYVGSMDPRYIDMDAMRHVGEARPSAFYGKPPGQRIMEDGMSPVQYGASGWLVGWVNHVNLSFALASGDGKYNDRRKVGLLPFLDIPLTEKVSPIKWWEYLLAGVRPVTMHLSQVTEMPFGVYTDDINAFLYAAITAAPFSDEEAREASNWVREHHMWAHRAKVLNAWMEGLL